MSLESQLDVLEDALPPTSRFAAWIDATMRGDAELARKLEEGGARIETAFVWKPFGFYVHAAFDVTETFWHELHLAYSLLRALEGQQTLLCFMAEEAEWERWLRLDEAARETYEGRDPDDHPTIKKFAQLRDVYREKLAATWRGFERFAHGEGFDPRMLMYALGWPAEFMEEIETVIELVEDVQAPNERIEYSRRMLLAIYAKQISRLSGDQCETRAYPETLSAPEEHADGRA